MRARLDEEMGTPPAGGIDVDALMARGRRQVRMRRFAAIGGGAGLSAVAFGAAVVVAVNGTGVAPGRLAAPPSESASASSSLPAELRSLAASTGWSPPGSRIPRPAPTAQNAGEKRVQGVVRELVGKHAPGYTAAKDVSGREPLEVRSGLVWRDGAWTPTEPTYEASADLTVRGRTGGFYIGIGRLGSGFSMSRSCADLDSGDTRYCVDATGSAGEKIVKITEKSAGGRVFIVFITRTDGTGIALITDDGNKHDTKVRSLAEPVFSQEQLVKIGSDPRLTL